MNRYPVEPVADHPTADRPPRRSRADVPRPVPAAGALLDAVGECLGRALTTVRVADMFGKEIADPGSQPLNPWGPQLPGEPGSDLLYLADYLDLAARDLSMARMKLTWAIRHQFHHRPPAPPAAHDSDRSGGGS